VSGFSFNVVVVGGHLTRDPDMRYTTNGTAIADLSIAVNYRTGRGDDSREEVSFVDVVAFGKTAESATQYLAKGRPVLVEGRLQQDRWDDRETGQKRSRHKVVAHRVHFIGGKGGDGAVPAGQRAQARKPDPGPPDFGDDDIPF
jgi:single-strand DNA-binding protein